MTKIPNVDWSEINWSQMVTHPTTAQQDNMRAVRMQFHGCHANAVDEANGKKPMVEAASRLSLGAQAPGVVGDPGTGNPHIDLWPAYDGYPAMGVGESIFSPEEIAQFQSEAMARVAESLEWARNAMQEVCGVDRRYLEGDTEFSDSDVEDYYLGKAPT